MIIRLRGYRRESRVPMSIVFVLLFLSSAVLGQEHDAHKNHARVDTAPAGNHAAIELDDIVLVNQDGQQVAIASEVIGDRIVVVDFVYTTCTTVCPVLSATFRQIQERLGDRLGDDVVLASVSVDPLRDTPARMKAYAGKLGAADGWVWLTGKKQNVTKVLEAFGAYTPNFEDHPSMILVGDGQSREWARFLGFPSARQILDKVNEFSSVKASRQSHTATQGSR